MAKKLSAEEIAVVTHLLQNGKTIKEIAKFASLEREAVRTVASDLDVAPASAAQRKAKELFGAEEGLSYKEIAEQMNAARLKTADGKPIHHLTVAGWVRDYGWRWGGADDGEYAPATTPGSASKSKYALRLSKTADAELNSVRAVKAAADAAWSELTSDATRVVQVAVIRGAAKEGVTNVSGVRKALLAAHGSAIRSARA